MESHNNLFAYLKWIKIMWPKVKYINHILLFVCQSEVSELFFYFMSEKCFNIFIIRSNINN